MIRAALLCLILAGCASAPAPCPYDEKTCLSAALERFSEAPALEVIE